MNAALILGILQLLPALIQGVETIFGKGTGAIKKQAVTDMATVALTAATALSTGGQKNTLTQIGPAIGPVIDALAGLMFPPKDETAIENLKPAD